MQTTIITKPRLAFAGVGWIGRNRLQAAAESGLAELVLLSDPSPECVAEALKITPTSGTTVSFEELLSNPNIDGIVIATPSALHKEQSVAAFEKGKAVFCQKPLGRNLAEVTAVVEAAKKNNKLLGTDMRKSIKGYNLELLNVLTALVCAVIVVSYFMYTMSPEVLRRMGTYRLYYTCVFVLAGIMRYLQIIFVQATSGSPTKILYRDRFIQASIILWIVSFYLIIYTKDITIFK